MQAIFAIPDTPKVIGNAMGLSWFLGVIFILFAFTITLAFIMANFSELRDKAPRLDTILHRTESYSTNDTGSMV